MTRVRPKRARLALDPEMYEKLRNQVLHRDGWRCQACGAMSNLEVHHKEFRSRSGDDSSQNLITLCTACHAGVHRTLGSADAEHLSSVSQNRGGGPSR